MSEQAGRLEFDDLHLYFAAFEVRFDDSFLIWDRSGAIWSEILRRFPEFKLRHAEPNRVTFGTSCDDEMQVAVQVGLVNVSVVLPDKKLERLSRVATHMTEVAADQLEVARYSRVGLRTQFTLDFKQPEAAAAAILSTGLVKVPDGPHFGLDAAPAAVEYSIRTEDGKNGFSLWLKTDTVKIDLESPFGFGSFTNGVHETRHRAILDVDRFMMSPVLSSQLRVEDWIAQTLHIIKRDGQRLLGG